MIRLTSIFLVCALFILGACDESGADNKTRSAAVPQAAEESIAPQHDVLDPARPDPPVPVPETLPAGLLEDSDGNEAEVRSLDPLCFLAARTAKPGDHMPVVGCAKKYSVSADDYYVTADDARGVNFGADDAAQKSFVEYKYLGDLITDFDFAVQVTAGGGPSPGFTRLMVLTREGNTLRVIRSIEGGERCAGGINEAAVNVNGDLLYTINLTPRGMIDMAGAEKVEGMKDYGELENCPACCYAVAEYKNDTLEAVTLNPGLREKLRGLPSPVPPAPGTQTMPECFNETVAYYLVRDRVRMLDFELKEFGEVFRDTCLIDWSKNRPAAAQP